ncbi:putative cyclase-domain-containing protein [Phellopilus nigrolimitatus]|nr:putative cyclase-domain-containing protein [Phellopilus nigrolimitatus]
MSTSRAINITQPTGSKSSESSEHKKWDNLNLPSFDELPEFNDLKGCAWSVWGKGDQLGTINLLTNDVVQEAARQVKTGQTVCLNWPLNFPEKPAFSRKPFDVAIIAPSPTASWRDDEITINTQAGSQWDGLRHCGIAAHGVFYQNTPATDIKLGGIKTPDPLNVDPELIKYGIHNWAQHGICGRGVFLDLVRYFTRNGAALPYDPWTPHSISVADLEACAKDQGVEFKQADILLIRMGFTKRYYESSQAEKDKLATSGESFAGVEQSEEMKRFLWNNHFAAVASDQPAFERWPPVEWEKLMHQTIIGLWGMPIGEIFDLEKLSEVCAATGRHTFFFTSWPLNILGGCASPPNAAVSTSLDFCTNWAI